MYDNVICSDICLIVQDINSCIDLLILINYKINYKLTITSLIHSCIIILLFYVFYYKQSSGNNFFLFFTTSRNRMSCFAFEPRYQRFFTFSVPEKLYTNPLHRKNSIELFILNPIFLMSLNPWFNRYQSVYSIALICCFAFKKQILLYPYRIENRRLIFLPMNSKTKLL